MSNLKSDPIKNLPETIAVSGDVAFIDSSIKAVGKDADGRTFSMPLTVGLMPDGYIGIAQSGRVTRLTGRLVGDHFLVVSQEPIPFGGSFQSSDEAAYRAARELV